MQQPRYFTACIFRRGFAFGTACYVRAANTSNGAFFVIVIAVRNGILTNTTHTANTIRATDAAIVGAVLDSAIRRHRPNSSYLILLPTG